MEEEKKQQVADEQTMVWYYKNAFPCKLMYNWLSYPTDSIEALPDLYFQRREFNFEIHDGIYLRYQSFDSAKSLQDSLIEKKPFKLDLGAVYNMQPSKKANLQQIPLEREFVIDIDMDSYDKVRVCCQGSKVCQKCIMFVKFACCLLNQALREDFGFKHILNIFSGRRGIHMWVCDQNARQLNNKGRNAIIRYLTMIYENQYIETKLASNVLKYPLHFSVERALNLIEKEDYFKKLVIKRQNLLMVKPEIILDVLHAREDIRTIGAERIDIKELILQEWSGLEATIRRNNEAQQQQRSVTSEQRWKIIEDVIARIEAKFDLTQLNKNNPKKLFLKQDIYLSLLYPRLDEKVSTTINHLLKSPFSMHVKTGKVCVPFTYEQIDRFNIDEVPTVLELQQSVIYGQQFDVSKSKLGPYIEVFQQFINEYQKDSTNLQKAKQPSSEGGF